MKCFFKQLYFLTVNRSFTYLFLELFDADKKKKKIKGFDKKKSNINTLIRWPSMTNATKFFTMIKKDKFHGLTNLKQCE